MIRLSSLLLLMLAGGSGATAMSGTDGGDATRAAGQGAEDIEALYRARADSARMRYTEADALFVTDMIGHHAQALAPDEMAEIERARAGGAFVVEIQGEPYILSDQEATMLLTNVVASRGGTGAPTAADSTTLRQMLPLMIAQMFPEPPGVERGPTQAMTSPFTRLSVSPVARVKGTGCCSTSRIP